MDDYDDTTAHKCSVFQKWLRFIDDGYVLKIAHPGEQDEKYAVYNGHKRKIEFGKFQNIFTTGGLIIHAHGPMKGCQHDWELYKDIII